MALVGPAAVRDAPPEAARPPRAGLVLRLRLLGGLALAVDGAPRPVPRARGPRVLLAWLALHPGVHARAAVAAELWPGVLDASARNSLRTALSALRAHLGPVAAGCVLAARETIGLAQDGRVAVDVIELEEHRRRDEHDLAIELCTGDLLVGLEDEWVLQARQQHRDHVLDSLGALARAAERRSDTEAAIKWTRRRVELDPLSEEALRELMRLLATAGRRAEALSMYARLRERLRRELAIAPSPPTRRLADELRHQRAPGRDIGQPLALPARLRARQRSGFVGRASELERLTVSWQRACAGERGVVLLVGEPGIGKSRLCAELAARLDDANVLYGACVEEGGAPYHGFAEALRPLLSALPAPAVERVAALVGDARPDPAEDPQAARYRLFAAVADVLGSACASHPTLLVLEDLHWADAAMLLMLEHVVRATAGKRLLVLGTHRPEGPPRLAATLAELHREEPCELIQLAGLAGADVRRIATTWLGTTPPPALVATVRDRTDGNPFFVEELLRHLSDTGREDPERAGVPETLRAVIAQRVARLSDDCGRALACAAVLGREFDHPTLRAMSAMDDDALDAALEEALANQLILDGDGAYAFKHALVRDAVYERHSPPRLRRLHLRAAEAIEALPQHERRVAEVASHLRLARDVADPLKAIVHSVAAGRSAARMLAWEEAAMHWRGGLELMEARGADPRAEARLRGHLGDLMYVTGFDLQRGIRYLEEALALYERAGDERGCAEVRWRLGRSYATFWGRTMDIPRALEHLEAAARLLQQRAPAGDARDEARHARVLIALAAVAVWQVRPAHAVDQSARALRIAERLGDEALWANAAAVHGTGLAHAGRLADGVELLDRAWRIADRLNLGWIAFLITYLHTAHCFWLLDPASMHALWARELDTSRQRHAPVPRRWLLGVRAQGYVIEGRLSEARGLVPDASIEGLPHLEAMLELHGGDAARALELWIAVRDGSRASGDRVTEAAAQLGLGATHRLAGDPQRAAPPLRRGLEAVAGRHVGFEVLIRAELAMVARPAEAQVHVERCDEILAAGEDWRGVTGVVALARATAAAASGRPDPAAAGFERAMEVFRDHGVPFAEAEALRAWGSALADAGHPAAMDRLDRAIELYERHGAAAFRREAVLAARARAVAV